MANDAGLNGTDRNMFGKKKDQKSKNSIRDNARAVLASWTIHWRELASDTYLYGSEIEAASADSVSFQNELMPPGAIIKEWYSKTNYRSQHMEPSLPMIDGESYYRLKINMEVPEGESCLVRLVFYDRYEEEAGTMIFDQPVTDFRCPLKTYSYHMQLVNGGMSSLVFHSITIEEVSPV